jgi:hypothetical protein
MLLSERAYKTYLLACSLARDYGAQLIVVHVAEPPVTAYGEGAFINSTEVDPELLRR